MAIATMCAGCGKSLNLPEVCLGKKMQCRYCGVLFLMPLPMAGRPAFPMLWSDYTARCAAGTAVPFNTSTLPASGSARRFVVPILGEVAPIANPLVVSETGVYESVKHPGEETALLPRIEKSRSGNFRPVDPKSDRYTMSRFASSGSSRGWRTAKYRSISDKTHQYQPVGTPALGYRRSRSSAEMSVLPSNTKNPGFNVAQIGSLAAILFVGILGFCFFATPHKVQTVKNVEKSVMTEAAVIPVSLKVREAEVVEVMPVRTAPKSVVSAKKVSKPAPVVAPVIVQEPEVEIVEIAAPQAQPVAVMPQGGTFESLNKAIGEAPANVWVSFKAQQAEAFSAKKQHEQAAMLYEQAAEEAEKFGHQEEAQLFSLKGIEERRALDVGAPRKPLQNRK